MEKKGAHDIVVSLEEFKKSKRRRREIERERDRVSE